METVIGSSRDQDRRFNLGCRDIGTVNLMCWHTQAGASWRSQPSWDGRVETHVLREVNRYKERSPEKKKVEEIVSKKVEEIVSKKVEESVQESEKNSVHGLEEMNSEWVILHIWRIVSVKSVRRAWKNYCNFSNIFWRSPLHYKNICLLWRPVWKERFVWRH